MTGAPGPQAGWRQIVSQMRQRARIYARWLRHEVPRDPGFAFYARRMGARDRSRFLQEQKMDPKAVMQARYAPFADAARPPRIVWMYWDQGVADAPYIVRHCIESWQRHNPDWDVRVLDATTVQDYVDLSDVPTRLPFRFKSDLLRVRLMARYGGVWADATVFCHRPLKEWVDLATVSGFFLMRNPGPGRSIASWFMAACPSHPLPVQWAERFGRYLRAMRYTPDLYFIFFYLFQWMVKRMPDLQHQFDQMPGLPATASFAMIDCFQNGLDVAVLERCLDAGLPVSKLSWKNVPEEAAFVQFCERLPQT